MITVITKLADAVINDIYSGLRGYHENFSISKELIEEEIVQMRLAVLKEYMLKGVIPVEDLLYSLNCIPVDCETLDKCKCNGIVCGTPTAHFEMPQVIFDFGLGKAINYIGSSDKSHPFNFYTDSVENIQTYQQYRKRGKQKPWVYIDVTPNSNGLVDCYIFNAPLIKQVSVTAIFKDPRLLEGYNCGCDATDIMPDNFNFIDIIVKERLTKLKILYYRLYAMPLKPNTQEYV